MGGRRVDPYVDPRGDDDPVATQEEDRPVRYASAVTSVSWIPSEAVTGPLNRGVFDTGMTHYDQPLPDRIDDLEALRDADAFRFANHLAAWVEVVDGRIVDAGHCGGGLMGSTTVHLGARGATFAGVSFPDLRNDPEVGAGTEVRFVQTVGGHTALPLPRRVEHAPFVQLQAPTVWTTLELTLRADGSTSHRVLGASEFPRHWVYNGFGMLTEKVGVTDFGGWARHNFGRYTPWGDHESPALVTTVESALERELADRIMRGGAPEIRRLAAGTVLTHQGERADEIVLLLDGVATVEVDGDVLAEVGPGAIIGERSSLEDGRRTSTVRARTPVRVAVAPADQLDPEILGGIGRTHVRELA